jgi:alpha-1,2-glucosyltransferase
MRYVSVLFGALNYVLIHRLIEQNLAPKTSKDIVWQHSLAIFLFPVMFFFYFMYYTDAGGLSCVLLCLYCFNQALWPLRQQLVSQKMFPNNAFSLVSKLWVLAAGISGLCAIVFRQTNVIWVAFGAASTLITLYETSSKQINEEGSFPTPGQLIGFVKFGLSNLPSIILVFWPVLLAGGAFAVFLLWNGSITVGDKTAHAAVFHWPQLSYFFLFSLLFLAWGFMDDVADKPRRLFRHLSFAFLFRNPLQTIATIGFVGLNVFLISRYTYAHLYLISDNRHFTFYIWKKIFERYFYARYILVAAYYVAAWFVLGQVLRQRSALWKLVFTACTAATIIPAQLIEFRYFIIPFNILAIYGAPIRYSGARVLQIVTYAAINIATIALFLLKPFRWPDGSEARFMW